MRCPFALAAGLAILGAQRLAPAAEHAWLDPRCRPLPTDRLGPFVHLADGGVLAIDAEATVVSRDGGRSWSAPRPLFPDGRPIKVSDERALLRTRGGAIIAAFMNSREEHWTWDDRRRDAPGARLPTYAMRSLDEGRTWQDVRKLHDDWTGAVSDMIQTRDGRVIFTSMKMLHDPGRHAVLTYSSTDDGRTWKPGNLIDLGGAGHHGGATEATVLEKADGRVWLLLRTNWGEFWSGYSFDGGRFWRVLQPSGIPASSAPGLLKRLRSGRVMLAWNRPTPEGKASWPRTGGDGLWSEVPVSNHREELSVAFSEDDGKTWGRPVVLARQRGRSLAYPYVFEYRPGEIWLTTMQGGVRVRLLERDFVGK